MFTVMDLPVPSNVRKFLSSCMTGGCSKRAQLHEVSYICPFCRNFSPILSSISFTLYILTNDASSLTINAICQAEKNYVLRKLNICTRLESFLRSLLLRHKPTAFCYCTRCRICSNKDITTNVMFILNTTNKFVDCCFVAPYYTYPHPPSN
jgi:hypothetical protein